MLYIDNRELKELVLQRAFPNESLREYRKTYYQVEEDKVIFTINEVPVDLGQTGSYNYEVEDFIVNNSGTNPIRFYRARRAYEVKQLEKAYQDKVFDKLAKMLNDRFVSLAENHKLNATIEISEAKIDFPHFRTAMFMFEDVSKQVRSSIDCYLEGVTEEQIKARLEGSVDSLFHRLLELRK